MKKFISSLFLLSALLLSACGSDLSDGDKEACDIYEETIESAQDDSITDDEMLEQLEGAWGKAESDKLQDSLDDMLIYFEEGEGDLRKLSNSIKVHCSIE